MRFKPVGIQKRTVTAILGTAVLVFVLFSLGLVIYQNHLAPARVQQFVAPYAEIIAVSAAPAVDYGDQGRAWEILRSLKSNPQILRADILTPDGRTLATYPATNALLDRAVWNRPDGVYLTAGAGELVRSFAVNGPHPARLFLRTSLALMQQRERQMLKETSLAVALILGIVAGLQYVLLRRWVLAPLTRLAAIAEDAGRQGDYSQRMPAHDRDELGQLGQRFNALLAAVEQREAALRRLANFQRAILSDAAYAIISTDTAGRITSLNPAAEKLLGRPAETLVGRATPEVFHLPSEVAARAEQLSAKLGAPVPAGFETFVAEARRGWRSEAEWTYVRPDGSRVPVLLSVTALRDERGDIFGFLGMANDITERKQAEAARHEAEELYRALVNTSPDGISVLDMTGRVLFSSPKALELFCGSSDAEPLAGRRAVEFASAKSRPRAAEFLRGALAGKFPLDERLLLRRHDGREFVAEVNGALLRDALGVPRGIMIITRDVTERQRQEDELKNKNTELERFTYTVSHDLKSPLITIKGFAGALLADAAAGHANRRNDDLKRIVMAADKMTDLLDGLLELSRIGRIINPPATVSMAKLADDVLALLAGPIAQQQAKITVQPGLPPAFGDAQRLLAVLQNLVENALKFSPPGQAPEIEIGFQTLGDQRAYFVRDHGCGIDARFRETIFGLFNKLDPHSEGTGLGLALARRIVEFHGGTIWAESAGAGQGATFYFTLPAGKATSAGTIHGIEKLKR